MSKNQAFSHHWQLKVACPFCGSAAGKKCKVTGEVRENYNAFHRARYGAAMAAGYRPQMKIYGLRPPAKRKPLKGHSFSQPEAGRTSALCDSGKHSKCCSLRCSCDCHKEDDNAQA